MESARVTEVRELAALLEENHLHKAAALRTAVECVYGMREEYQRRQYIDTEIDAAKEDDADWDKAWRKQEGLTPAEQTESPQGG